jgi:multidrug resistance protein
MKQRTLVLLFVTVFVLVLGFSIVFPLFPFYAKEFGASVFQISLLFAVFPLMQFIFSPLMGKFSDVFGRRPIILSSLAASAIFFFLFGIVGSFNQLLLVRSLHGIAASAGLPTVWAAGADISKKAQRAKTMGLLWSAFSLAIVFGPAFGGLLSSVSIEFPFFVSGAIAFVNLIFVYFLIPETNTQKTKSVQFKDSFVLVRIASALRTKLAPIYIISSVSFLSFSIAGVAFPLFALERYAFGAFEVGLVFVGMGIAGASVQGLIVGRVVERFGEVQVIRAGLVFMMISLAIVSLAKQALLAAALLSLMSVGTSLINPSNSSYISKRAGKIQGFALGTLNSFGSLSRFVGSLIVGIIFQQFGASFTFGFTSFVVFLGLLLSLRLESQVRQDKIS